VFSTRHIESVRLAVRRPLLPLGILLLSVAVPAAGAARDKTPWTVSRFFERPVTWDGMHVTEGTSAAPKWSWRATVAARYLYDIGLARRASQFLLEPTFGVGLPKRFDAGLRFPVGYTIGSRAPAVNDPSARELQGMGADGPGIGDLGLFLLWSAIDASEGGLGLLFGVKGGMPTGHHDRLLGEGWFSVEPMVSLAFQVFGSRLSLNAGYLVRPEHLWRAGDGERKFEQDDDVLWGVGLRVPKKNDVAWSIEVEGALGVLTYEGGWPSSDSRAVALAGGVDFPLGRLRRMAITTGVGLTGEAAPTFTFGLTLWWVPVPPDEDKDGVGGLRDECPLLLEDWDGFEDKDGCPDLDNDKDGFPDDEDRCPLVAADDFSDDGCPAP
jgi:hypothetical protein